MTQKAAALQLAYVGMQCFWGVESSFARLPGVIKTRVGYAGGTTQSPTYYNIGDHTGFLIFDIHKQISEMSWAQKTCG
jgi:peptide-methionine (S)-S-oxide reductase